MTVDLSGVYSVTPPVPWVACPGDGMSRRALAEEEVASAWLEVLLADEMVPVRPIAAPPL